jgi:hypothetical protein
VIALTTLGVCLAYAMPLFLYAKVNNAKSEIRTGALIVSQRVFDNIRSKPINGLPINDGRNNPNLVGCVNPYPDLTGCTNNANSPNPVLTPNNLSTPTDSEKLLTRAMGRQYQTKVTYCKGLLATPAFGGDPPEGIDPTVCTSKYRKFKVEVNYNGEKVYDLEGTYTEFE